MRRALTALRYTHDYVAIEVFLKPKALSSMSSTLLMSNIFTIKQTEKLFVAHHDDGLAFDVFERLALELRQVFGKFTSRQCRQWMKNTPVVSVKKYYVMSIDLAKSGIGALSLGEPGQIAPSLAFTSPRPT